MGADWDLLERVTAAAMNSANVHDSLCTLFEEPGDDGEPLPCSCGIPALLEDLAALLQGGAAAELIRQAEAA